MNFLVSVESLKERNNKKNIIMIDQYIVAITLDESK